jgi:hypothetical protein
MTPAIAGHVLRNIKVARDVLDRMEIDAFKYACAAPDGSIPGCRIKPSSVTATALETVFKEKLPDATQADVKRKVAEIMDPYSEINSFSINRRKVYDKAALIHVLRDTYGFNDTDIRRISCKPDIITE